MDDAQYYLSHIAAYEREFKDWEGRARKIVKRYRNDERKNAEGASFNVLWSNVQTLKAATYARMPQPDVSRRYRDNDPVGRVASLMIERALDFEVKNYPDFANTMRAVVYDRFLGGRGTCWVRYEPITRKEEVHPHQLGEMVTDADPEPVTIDVLDFEMAPVDYVHWNDFGHNVCRTWSEVSVVWRKVYMGRRALKERFGEVGGTVPLDSVPDDKQTRTESDQQGINRKGLVYEIWDKDEGKVFWLSKSLGEVLEERDDPLGLEEFFPCPRPIYATLTTDSLVPVPDFLMYQDQARELDKLADRIDGLIDALKVRGVYDAGNTELARLFKEGESGDLIPVNNWAALAEKKGLAGSIDLVEIMPFAQALNECYKAFEQVKAEIYELTGISDILRGQTNADETATAQQIKNSYASLRLKTYQNEVERFACDIFRIKAEIICNHFDPSTLMQMAAADQLSQVDQQALPQALQLLKSNPMREFRIEVETDSMAFQDEQQEKNDRMEFLKATQMFIAGVVQASAEQPQMMPVAVELLKFGVGAFRIGKGLEGVIDQAAEKMEQQAQQPKPNPDQMKLQQQGQIEQMKVQAEQQATQAKIQGDMQLAQAKAQADVQVAAAKAQTDAQLEQHRITMQQQSDAMNREHDAQLKRMQAELDASKLAQQIEFDRWKAQLDAETKILVAQIGVEGSLRQSAMNAAIQPEKAPEGEPVQEQPDVAGALQTALVGFQQAIQTLRQPRTVLRDADGRIAGVQ